MRPSMPWSWRLAIYGVSFAGVLVAAWRYAPGFHEGASALLGDARKEVSARMP